MKLRFTCLIILFLSIYKSGWGQPKTSVALRHALQERPTEPIQVVLFLEETINFNHIKDSLDKQGLSPQKRADKFRKMVQTARKSTQSELIAILNAANEPNYQAFWIANVITAKIPADLLSSLVNIPQVMHIDLESQYQLVFDEPTIATLQPESLNGIEPGLIAIGAPFMWQMGYTGNGSKAFIVDTGLWPTHPAVRNRWMGNRVPLDHAWLGFDRDFPADKSSSHGTHVTGTVLGLDTATNDTIGVAPNAYFIATDPIVSNLAFVKPVQAILGSFEFAFNPDGDTTTTDDIPHAINNSWGFAIPNDSSLCNGSMANLALAMEASGIATIFSAGNNGPGLQSLGSPQFISPSILSWFTVGALNGSDTTYPIANFSSRGPTICHASGPLSIKPEVSAPGVGVRSAIGQAGYSAYNGTSMASPHVTGAIMLLREAFPQLTGVQLMEALYYSAIDLGLPGEDNTYGRGIISLPNAYQWLIANHTPSMPLSKDYDLALKAVLAPSFTKSTCEGMSHPVLVVQNNGNQPIRAIKVIIKNKNQQWQYPSQALQLAPNALDTVVLSTLGTPILQWGTGFQELQFKVVIDSTVTEYDTLNNQLMVRFHSTQGGLATPYTVPFDTFSVTKAGWFSENVDDDAVFWDSVSVIGAQSARGLVIKNSTVMTRSFQKDYLFSPAFDVQPNMVLQLQLASTSRASAFRDTLRISASTDCGINFTQLLFEDGGSGIRTYSGGRPTLASHWRTLTLPLNALSGQQIMFRFENQYDMGGDLYLANIQLTFSTAVNEILSAPKKHILFPNPSNGLIKIATVDGSLGNQKEIVVFNLLGKTVGVWPYKQVMQNNGQLDLSHLTDGVYLIQIVGTDVVETMKLVMKKAN